jgi:hypothetical protein
MKKKRRRRRREKCRSTRHRVGESYFKHKLFQTYVDRKHVLAPENVDTLFV